MSDTAKPQRRTIVKALDVMVDAVRRANFLGRMSKAENDPFRELLDAADKAEAIVKRERNAQKKVNVPELEGEKK